MKDTVVLLFDSACIYEIVTLNYFLKFTDKNVIFTSLSGQSVKAMEGYSLNVDKKLNEIETDQVKLLVIPGGNVSDIDQPVVWDFIGEVKKNGGLIAAICAGVDVLDHGGFLDGIDSTHSTEEDVVVTEEIITARANAHVDFAIEVARKLDLFVDEADLKETIDFWRDHKRME